jgi:hypothetical protein
MACGKARERQNEKKSSEAASDDSVDEGVGGGGREDREAERAASVAGSDGGTLVGAVGDATRGEREHERGRDGVRRKGGGRKKEARMAFGRFRRKGQDDETERRQAIEKRGEKGNKGGQREEGGERQTLVECGQWYSRPSPKHYSPTGRSCNLAPVFFSRKFLRKFHFRSFQNSALR